LGQAVDGWARHRGRAAAVIQPSRSYPRKGLDLGRDLKRADRRENISRMIPIIIGKYFRPGATIGEFAE